MIEDNNMMQAQYASYSLSSGGNYSFTGMGTMQNNEIPYHGVPSPFDNNQQQIGGSAAPDFIPFNTNSDKNDRYFNWNNNDQPSDVRGGRSSYSNDGTLGDWNRNRLDEYPKRSGSDTGGGISMRDSYRWDKGDDRRRNKDEAGSSRFDHYSRQYNERRERDNSYDRSAKRPKVSHFEKPSARNDFGSSYSGQSRGNQREHGGAPNRGYQNRAEQKHSFKNVPNKAPYSRGQDFKPPRSLSAGNQSWKQPKSFPPPKVHKKIDNPEVIKNKDETWRGQAVSAIVKDLLVDNGMYKFVKNQGLLSYIKPIVRLRIDQMLGKRVAVPLAQIIEEYKSRNPPGAQTEFIIEERKKYEWTRYDSRLITKEEYEASVSQLDAQLNTLKRRGPNPFKKLKKAKMAPKRPPPPSGNVLPKYPENDKKEYNKLKRLESTVPGVYDHKLDPKLKSALDKEIEVLCDMFKEECQKAENDDEKKISTRILSCIDGFRQQVNLHVAKRVLNITKNLPLMAFTEERVNSKEVKEQLKGLGIATFRKCLGKNKYVATCRTFEQYDHFCAQSTFVINGQTIVFRPLHMGRPSKKKKNRQNETAQPDAANEGDIDNDNDDQGEGLGDDGEGSDEELGDEFEFEEYDEEDIIDDDDKKDDKKEIQLKHDSTVVEASKTEVSNLVPKTEPQVDKTEEEVKLEMADEKTDNIPETIKPEEKTDSPDETVQSEEKTDSTDEPVRPEEKTDSTDEKVRPEEKTELIVKEMDNAATAKLYQDIQALSESINEGIVDTDVENNVDNEEDQNISQISQEDLEDF